MAKIVTIRVETDAELAALEKTHTVLKKVEEQATSTKTAAAKAGKSVDKAGSEGKSGARGILELSRAFEDLQYGIRGVLNNIPGTIQAFGGTAKAAGLVSIAAVGADVIFRNLSQALKLGGDAGEDYATRITKTAGDVESALERIKESQDDLTKSIEATATAREENFTLIGKELSAQAKLAAALVQGDDSLSDITKIQRLRQIAVDEEAAAGKRRSDSLQEQERETRKMAEAAVGDYEKLSSKADEAYENLKRLQAQQLEDARVAADYRLKGETDIPTDDPRYDGPFGYLRRGKDVKARVADTDKREADEKRLIDAYNDATKARDEANERANKYYKESESASKKRQSDERNTAAAIRTLEVNASNRVEAIRKKRREDDEKFEQKIEKLRGDAAEKIRKTAEDNRREAAAAFQKETDNQERAAKLLSSGVNLGKGENALSQEVRDAATVLEAQIRQPGNESQEALSLAKLLFDAVRETKGQADAEIVALRTDIETFMADIKLNR